MLLRFEAVHVHWQFRRRHDIGEENEPPAFELRAIAEVEVLGERVMLPATGLLNAGFAPETGGAVEVEKAPASAARHLFEEKVAVEEHRLHAGEKRVAAIEVAPAGLDHADFRIGEKVDGRLEQLRLWDKVGVEDANEFPPRRGQPGLERSRLVADAMGALNQLDIKPAGGEAVNRRAGQIAGLVGRIVEHLDLQEFPRIIEFAD